MVNEGNFTPFSLLLSFSFTRWETEVVFLTNLLFFSGHIIRHGLRKAGVQEETAEVGEGWAL